MVAYDKSKIWIQKGQYGRFWLDKEWLWSLQEYFLTCEIWEYWRDGWQLVVKSWDVVGVSSCSCRGHPSQSSSPVFCIVLSYQFFNNYNGQWVKVSQMKLDTIPEMRTRGLAIHISWKRKAKDNAVALTCASWACCIFCWRNMKPGKLLLKPYPDQLEVGVRGEASTCSFIAVWVKSFTTVTRNWEANCEVKY